ncbi:RagB/SusD family nutrient uptake outer membrane protein [Maribacter polysiphoniae]|uniref:Putative outer membrane starch-binding protein n=1 Tax=Maribacter polysiphoniae TaxID=429344 RepID=A0A316E115_9FLAO|nr:RagB/SusD family nutrient uptake outer membrane protein [Maribacter polysiphoniae]MBD1260558.1 RagB/SusD family nutrient uptake outer membrane protein [Maribacter polysiphoniae]PWK24317.1 putative outer membrane starch-binding protein [Maribacter polysiphoniae]
MKKYIFLAGIITMLAWSCTKNDEEFLDRPPSSLLTQDQIFKDPSAVLSVLGDLYNRYEDFGRLDDWASVAQFNVAYWSEVGRYQEFQNDGWGYGSWGIWDYGYIREINLFLERCEEATELEESLKARFLAEGRFLRASYYFEMVKRMGGVPLILESETYDFSGDASYLQHPRETEAAIYDFVIGEADALKDILPTDVNSKSRATKGAVLAMKARAALYAGSIAKYGTTTPQVSLPGNEVGIPASMADGYYTQALSAAEAIINGDAGAYGLYTKKPNLSENFEALFYDKANNPEAIFVEDYKVGAGKIHYFTGWNQPRYGAEEEEGGRINPSLQLVQSFEMLDGTYAPLENEVGGNPVYYDNIDDIFQNRDARLAGTVILPGSTFKSKPVDIWAGVVLADGSIVSGDSRGQEKTLPGATEQVQVVGFDGPIDGLEFTAQSGFYIRKYQDPNTGSGRRGTQSDVWFIRYRYGEVLLNAAEAAFELAQPDVAAGYLNELRARAGITVPLTGADVSFDKIAHERYVELAFEGLHFFDLKRWRLAHVVLDGNPISETEVTQNIGVASKRETQPYSIWPYRYHNPGDPNDGKWLYKTLRLSRITGADRFQLGNYYSEIGQDLINNNPKLVRNPNQ